MRHLVYILSIMALASPAPAQTPGTPGIPATAKAAAPPAQSSHDAPMPPPPSFAPEVHTGGGSNEALTKRIHSPMVVKSGNFKREEEIAKARREVIFPTNR